MLLEPILSAPSCTAVGYLETVANGAEKFWKLESYFPLFATAQWTHWEIVSESPTAVRGDIKSLKGSHKTGDGRIF
jgi:hypothetical protein